MNTTWVKISYTIFILAFAIEQASGYAINPMYKYFFWAFTCAICVVLLCFAPRNNKILWSVLVNQVACAVVFILVSLFALYVNHFRIYPEFVRDLFRLLGPPILAFLLYNVDHSNDNMDFYFHTFFIIEAAEYFLVSVYPVLSIQSLMSISLADSFSPFENVRASRFTICLVYYMIRNKPIPSFIALLANFFTFKRFNMLFSVFFIVFGWKIVKMKQSVPNWLVNMSVAFFCVIPMILLFLVSDTFERWFVTTFHKDVHQFTMGRLEQYIYIFNYKDSLLGLGSTAKLFKDRYNMYSGVNGPYYTQYLHSDLLRFYVETTFLGLVAYLVSMFNLVKIRKRYFTYITMLFLITLMAITPNFGDFPVYMLLFLICQIDFDRSGEVSSCH